MRTHHSPLTFTGIALATLLISSPQVLTAGVGYKDTPMQPNSKWHVHDSDRPMAPVVTPGETFSQGVPAPSDAIVLFDGKDLSQWSGNKGPATWKVEGGYMEAVKGAGDIRTKEQFGDCQVHLEFATPAMPDKHSQDRANSGVYLQDRYEVQVLDSFGLNGEDNECGGIYTVAKPLVNMCLPPLQWQTYDIQFKAAKFDDTGRKVEKAIATVKHNGVIIQDNTSIPGPTGGGAPEKPVGGPIQLQGHGNPVFFRNVWIVPE